MISIIVSSYKPYYFAALEKNIADTCGITYQLIKVDNHGKMGICEAYNLGAKDAIYPNLVFAHEDILFRTENWGKKLIDHLNIEKTGVLGFAGGNYVPTAPSSWATENGNNFLHLIQNNKEGNQPKFINSVTKNRTQVYCIDGVFLAINKKVFNDFYFNENVKGFHGYDLDFSLRVAKKYQNFVISNILIEHFSHGIPDKFWFENNILIRRTLGTNYQTLIDADLERKMFLSFVEKYFTFKGFSIIKIIKTLEFLPVGKIKFEDFKKILKHYYYYFKYRKAYHKKFNSQI